MHKHEPETSKQLCTLPTLQNEGFKFSEISAIKGRLHVQIGSMIDTTVSTTQRFEESSSIPMGRESVRIFMFLFWPWSRLKKFYKSDEKTFMNFEKIDSSLYNLSKEISYGTNSENRVLRPNNKFTRHKIVI